MNVPARAPLLVPGFVHQPGRHCGSTALADLMKWGGWPLSEAACFGLGAGLDTIFLSGNEEFPLGSFLGRGADLEDFFFENLGLGRPRRKLASFAEMLTVIESSLPERPVLLQGDVAALDYYNSPEHFPGHKFLVVGRDGQGRFLCADTGFPELMPVGAASLERSLAFESALFPGRFQYFAVELPLPALSPDVLSPAVRRSLRRTAERLGRPRTLGASLTSAEAAFVEWKKHCDFAKRRSPRFELSARFAYQVIEKRGTGRAAFRFLFDDYLAQLESDSVAGQRLGLFETAAARATLAELRRQTRATAQAYRAVASTYKMLSIGRKDLTEAQSEMYRQLDRLEREEKQMARLLEAL